MSDLVDTSCLKKRYIGTFTLISFSRAFHTLTSGCSAASNWQPGPHAVSTIVDQHY